MSKHILDRYTRTSDNRLIIDITARKVEDLYNDLDKHKPYKKKDLDPDLVEYIIDSANEIGKEDFVIQFRFETITNPNLTSRIKTSIHNYFLYLKVLLIRELMGMVKTSAILFSIGFLILTFSVWLNHKFEGQGEVITHVIVEGLTIAAWVSLWNAIATFLISWVPQQTKIKLYARIAKATILIHDEPLA